MLFYLNGTSSSGKSTIAAKIQERLKEPCFYFSIDTLLYSLWHEDLDAVMGRKPYRQKMNWQIIFSGYLASVAALVNAGHVIADCPVYMENIAQDFEKNIAPVQNKIVVRIDCPNEILEAREIARGDRVPCFSVGIGIALRLTSVVNRRQIRI